MHGENLKLTSTTARGWRQTPLLLCTINPNFCSHKTLFIIVHWNKA